jgi:hypothetical protein
MPAISPKTLPSRRHGPLPAVAAVLALSLALVALPAAALRCGTGVVSRGDSTLELLETCGRPTLIEEFNDTVPRRTWDLYARDWVYESVVEPYEVWTYNFGPRRFITRVRIRRGRIDRIETEGYGF